MERKLTYEQAKLIRKLRETNPRAWPYKRIMATYGLTKPMLKDLLRGKTYRQKRVKKNSLRHDEVAKATIRLTLQKFKPNQRGKNKMRKLLAEAYKVSRTHIVQIELGKI